MNDKNFKAGDNVYYYMDGDVTQPVYRTVSHIAANGYDVVFKTGHFMPANRLMYLEKKNIMELKINDVVRVKDNPKFIITVLCISGNMFWGVDSQDNYGTYNISAFEHIPAYNPAVGDKISKYRIAGIDGDAVWLIGEGESYGWISTMSGVIEIYNKENN